MRGYDLSNIFSHLLGEELTFDYGVESEFRGDTIFHCLCGAESCTGFMGRSKKLAPVSSLFLFHSENDDLSKQTT